MHLILQISNHFLEQTMLYNVFMLVLGLVSRNALGNRGATH